MRMLSPISTNVLEDFDRIVDSFLRPSYTGSAAFQSACNINETENHFIASFDMPGVKTEDLAVEVKGSQLMITGERKGYGKYERVFELPNSINVDKIEAHYENGVLNLALPKSETTKGRTIKIQSGETENRVS